MLCRDITEMIERAYPVRYAEEWDNVGLLAGREDKEVTHIYVALDATDEVIADAEAAGADMLLTHHPLIFGGLKSVTDRDFIGRRVLRLLQADISYYAMHTNYDVVGMAELSCRKLHVEPREVLEVTYEEKDGRQEGIGRIAETEELSLRELCGRVKDAYGLETVRLFGDPGRKVTQIALCPGSGKSVIETALKKGAEVLITGDIGHHDGLDATARGMAVIDAGHYGIEHIFTEDMKRYLEETLAGVKVTAAPVSHPFQVL